MPISLRLLGCAGAMSFATVAHATDSWVIYAEGDKPDRRLWVVDAQSLADRADLVGFLQTASPQDQQAYVKQLRRKRAPKPDEPRAGPEPVFEVNVNEVFENAAKPNRISSTYRVNCAKQTVGIHSGLVQWRDRPMDDLPPERLGATQAAVDPWQVQLARFVCLVGPEPGVVNAKEDMIKRGFLPIGDVGLSPVDLVWTHIWKDGTRPAFTYRVTEAELEATEQRLESNLARGGQLAGRVVDDFQRSASRVGRNNLMDMWIGKTEQEFAQTWGTPDSFDNHSDGSRTLYYHRGERVQGLNVYGHVVSDVNNRCDITVLTVGGHIRDYATQGATCAQQLR